MQTMNFGGRSPPQMMWEMQHRAQGSRITKCHPSSVVRRPQMLGEAKGEREAGSRGWGGGVSMVPQLYPSE